MIDKVINYIIGYITNKWKIIDDKITIIIVTRTHKHYGNQLRKKRTSFNRKKYYFLKLEIKFKKKHDTAKYFILIF